MTTINDIIKAYEKDWHKVDGLYTQDVQMLEQDEILEIIEEAQGRDILIDETNDQIDGQWYKFDGKINDAFDITDYL